MKALLWIAAIAVVVVGVGFAIMRLFGDLSDRSDSAATFAESVAAAVTTAWDPKSLEPMADPAFYTSVTGETGTWANYALLGPATSPPICRMTTIEINNGKAGGMATCPVKFARGTGALHIYVSDHSGQWRVVDLKLQL